MKRILVISILCLACSATVLHAKEPKHKSHRCVSPASVQAFLQASTEKPLRATSDEAPRIFNSGNVVVVEADSQLLIISNPFDLKRNAIRFQPVLRNRYTYSLNNSPFNGEASDTISLLDDDSYELRF